LVVPLLLLLVLGVIDFGRAWHTYQVITDAAREGARLAVVARTPSATPADVEAAVRDALSRRNLPSGSATTMVMVGLVQPAPPATPIVWPGSPGDPAQVRVEQEFTFLFMGPLLRWAANRETITLSTTSVMRKEW
jgi:Flp pilus assembly protein TadG